MSCPNDKAASLNILLEKRWSTHKSIFLGKHSQARCGDGYYDVRQLQEKSEPRTLAGVEEEEWRTKRDDGGPEAECEAFVRIYNLYMKRENFAINLIENEFKWKVSKNSKET